MCGIAGVLGSCSPETLRRMCAVQAHRGPDDEGFYRDDRVALGMRRLSIIDLEGGRQPIANEDGSVCIVFNGEIYNYRELAAELQRKGHRLRTASDTETIVHLYEEHGAECVHRLRGMFAFALWDARTGRLLLARDRAGVKPLYYTEAAGSLIFASEIKAILEHPAVRREVDREALDTYLAFQYVPGPRTLFAGVRKLPAGHLLHADDRGVRLERYWDLDLAAPAAQMPEPEAAEALRALLEEAVRGELVADVPLGALLSGGVDSATVVGLMSRHASGPVRCFTIGFDDAPGYDEVAEAREIASRFGAEHHVLRARPGDLELLPGLIWHLDEPVADPAALPTFLICRYARERVKVVLTGEGGDELFGGYPRYAWFGVARRLSVLHPALRETAAGWLRRAPHLNARRFAERVLRCLPDERRHLEWVGAFGPEEAARLGRSDGNGRGPETALRLVREWLDRSGAPDPIAALMYLDFKTWLADDILAKVDKMSMAASLEARVPLLDHRVLEFAARLPTDWKVRGLQTKRILKRAVADLLPPGVTRRRKHAFQVPVGEWLRNGAARWAGSLLLSGSVLRPRDEGGLGLEPARVRWLLEEHAEGRREFGRELWTLLCLEVWHRVFIERSLRPTLPGGSG